MALALKYLGAGLGAKLRLLRENPLTPGDIFLLPDRGLVLGRPIDNDIPLGVNWVSRRHCRVVPTGSANATIEDLGSAYGTYVRGEAIAVATLNIGDEVVVGMDGDIDGYRFALVDTLSANPDLISRPPLNTARLVKRMRNKRKWPYPLLYCNLASTEERNHALSFHRVDADITEFQSIVQSELGEGDFLERIGGDVWAGLVQHTSRFVAAVAHGYSRYDWIATGWRIEATHPNGHILEAKEARSVVRVARMCRFLAVEVESFDEIEAHLELLHERRHSVLPGDEVTWSIQQTWNGRHRGFIPPQVGASCYWQAVEKHDTRPLSCAHCGESPVIISRQSQESPCPTCHWQLRLEMVSRQTVEPRERRADLT